jgi:hypothetical protein
VKLALFSSILSNGVQKTDSLQPVFLWQFVLLRPLDIAASLSIMSDPQSQYRLSEEQKQHWLDYGFIKVPRCFNREAAAEFTSSVWTRLGVSPTDKTTWTQEKVNMPGHTMISVESFAPKAWHAICELVGGAERVADWCKDWKDGWIVNMGKPEYDPEDPLDIRSLNDWHNDGDWFVHFLDSPEQALLVIPLFSDIKSKGGGTAICTDGIGLVAQYLVCAARRSCLLHDCFHV